MKISFPAFITRKVISLIIVCLILIITASWVIVLHMQRVRNLTPEEVIIEQARKGFLQTHKETIDDVYFDCRDATIPLYVVGLYYLKWFDDSDGYFLCRHVAEYSVNAGKIELTWDDYVLDSCVLYYLGKQPILSTDQANQTFFMLVKRSPLSKWVGTVLSVNITETSDYYKESVMFQHTGINCPNARLIFSYVILKIGAAMLASQKVIFF